MYCEIIFCEAIIFVNMIQFKIVLSSTKIYRTYAQTLEVQEFKWLVEYKCFHSMKFDRLALLCVCTEVEQLLCWAVNVLTSLVKLMKFF